MSSENSLVLIHFFYHALLFQGILKIMTALILRPAIHTEVELDVANLTLTMSELLLKVCKVDETILVVNKVSALPYSEGFLRVLLFSLLLYRTLIRLPKVDDKIVCFFFFLSFSFGCQVSKESGKETNLISCPL